MSVAGGVPMPRRLPGGGRRRRRRRRRERGEEEEADDGLTWTNLGGRC